MRWSFFVASLLMAAGLVMVLPDEAKQWIGVMAVGGASWWVFMWLDRKV